MKNFGNSNDGVKLFGFELNLQLIVMTILVMAIGIGIGLAIGNRGQKTDSKVGEPTKVVTGGDKPDQKKVDSEPEVIVPPALKSDDPIKDGKTAFDRQNYALALKYFDLAVENSATKAEGYHWRGIVYACSQLPDSAIKEFDQAVGLVPDSVPLLLDRAAAYYDLHELAKAVEDYDAILKTEPRNSDALFGRALANHGQANFTAALSDLNSAISISPSVRAYELQGDILCSTKNFQGALDSYSQGLNLAPKDYELKVRQARVYLMDGRAKEALKRFEALTKERSGRGDIKNDEGYAEIYLGRYYDALLSFNSAKDSWNSNVLQANIKYAANKLVAQSLAALKRRRNVARIYSELAYAYLSLRDFDAAENSARQAVNLNSRDSYSWFTLGSCQYERNQFEQADASFSRAYAINPKYSTALFELARAAAGNGDHERAIEKYEEHHKLEQDSVAYSNEANSYLHLNKYDDAERVARKALEIDPSCTYAMTKLSITCEKKNDSTGALSWINRALAEAPNDPDLYQHRALAYFQANECDLALRDAHKALTLDHTDKLARYTLQLILIVAGTPEEMLNESKIGANDYQPSERDYLFSASMLPWYAYTWAGDSAQAEKYLQDGMKRQTRGNKWPLALVEYIAGQKTREQCLAACEASEQTEAYTWFGAVSMVKGDKEKAMEDFKWVAENGNPFYLESSLAKALLARNAAAKEEATAARPN